MTDLTAPVTTNRLAGRVAIVTGAAGGIGGGVARRYAAEGAHVVATDRNADGLDALVDELTAGGSKAVAVACDVAEAAQIETVVKTALDRFGTIDILANIAQGGLDEHTVLEEATAEQALYAFRTGPLQYMTFMQQCLPTMKANGYGRIINTASAAAVSGPVGYSVYAVAKGAVMALTRVASQEWGRYGITTNTFLPVARTGGFDLTPQARAVAEHLAASIPVGRFGDAYGDVAPLLVFLASPEAGYINGQAITADGGLTLIA